MIGSNSILISKKENKNFKMATSVQPVKESTNDTNTIAANTDDAAAANTEIVPKVEKPIPTEGRVYWYDQKTIDLCAYYKSEKCSDTKIWLEDGHFCSHQVLLSAVSPFFKRIYDANPEHLYTIGAYSMYFYF